MKTVFILSIAVSLFLSCSQKPGKEVNHKVIVSTTPELVLNGTEQWESDEPTMNSMLLLEELMREHAALKENNTIEAYNALGIVLDEELQHVFKNCTMKGEAHDMLHKFLVPVVDNVKALQSDDIVYARMAHKRLETRINQFRTYFK